MLTIERTPTDGTDPITIDELAEHMRLDADLVSGAYAYAHAAAAEIEAYCDIALMHQTITAISEPLAARFIQLPIGPVAVGASVTVDLIEQDGSYTPVTDGWFLQAGPRASLHFSTTPGGRLRIQYEAGYAEVPADLRMAICDLAARLYDYRASEKSPSFPAAAARICARYRRVKL